MRGAAMRGAAMYVAAMCVAAMGVAAMCVAAMRVVAMCVTAMRVAAMRVVAMCGACWVRRQPTSRSHTCNVQEALHALEDEVSDGGGRRLLEARWA